MMCMFEQFFSSLLYRSSTTASGTTGGNVLLKILFVQIQLGEVHAGTESSAVGKSVTC